MFDMSQVDLFTMLQWLASFSAVAAAVGAIASAIVAYRIYRRQSDPDVIAYVGIPEGSRLMSLFIENIGNAPAYDVSIKIEGTVPFLEGSKPSLEKGALGCGIPFLPPNGKRMIPLDVSYKFIEKMEGKTAFANVAFSRLKDGDKDHACFPIEGHSFEGCIVENNEVADGLRKVSGSLADIAKNVCKTRN